MPALAAHAGSELAALMVRDAQRAEALAREHGAPRWYDSVDGLLDDGGLDAVYVSTPVNLHLEHVTAAARRGLHVLCEKPMALTAADCRRMIDACARAGVHLEICFVLRGWPIYQRIRQRLAAGDLGRLVEIRAHLAKWTPRQPGEWRLDPRQSGGGALIDFGSHYLDLFRYLAGDFRRIAAMHSAAVFGYPVEESAFVLVEFAGGGHGVLGCSGAVPHNGNVLEIYGTEATLLLGKELQVITAAGTQRQPAEYPDYFSGLIAHFCACVEHGGEPLASGLDGLRNMEAIEAAYRSAREHRIVELAS